MIDFLMRHKWEKSNKGEMGKHGAKKQPQTGGSYVFAERLFSEIKVFSMSHIKNNFKISHV